MAGVMSVIGVGFGAAVAYAADRVPLHREALETAAGLLLIGGLALLGTALPIIL